MKALDLQITVRIIHLWPWCTSVDCRWERELRRWDNISWLGRWRWSGQQPGQKHREVRVICNKSEVIIQQTWMNKSPMKRTHTPGGMLEVGSSYQFYVGIIKFTITKILIAKMRSCSSTNCNMKYKNFTKIKWNIKIFLRFNKVWFI